MTINELIEKAHGAAKAKGFWDKERNTGELLMLIVSECGEALEAHRKGKRSDLKVYEGAVEHHKNTEFKWDTFFKRDIKDTFEDELADIVIRIADYLGSYDGGAAFASHPYPEKVLTGNVGELLLDVTRKICGAGTIPVSNAMCDVFYIAKGMDIDLWRHIELKLAYNETRERLHGKSY